MNEEQLQRFLKSNEEATSRAIEKHVNGHIREMKEDLKEHATADLKYQEKIDGNVAWVVKLILGAVILGIIATIIK